MNVSKQFKCVVLIFFLLVFSNTNSFSQVLRKTEFNTWEFRKIGDKEWLHANVPGTVHLDLMSNKIISDPFSGDKEKDLQWIDTCSWEYQTFFDCDSSLLASNHIELQFDGLDTYAKIFLNDVLLQSTDNMFRTWKVDCKNVLKGKQNHLLVQFESAIKKGKELAKQLSYTLPGEERVFTRKAAYQYGWDFAPRFVTCGIWRPVSLVSWDIFQISDLHIMQDEVSDTVANMVIEVHVKADIASTIYFKTLIEGTKRDSVYFEQQVRPGENTLNLNFKVRKPKLWWCNGLGESFMYHMSIQCSNIYQKSEIRKASFGIRKIEFVQKNDTIGGSFYFKLNGIPVFMKGANYVPADVFLPRVKEDRYKEIVQSAVDANMNMLRVWGGGVYEDDQFYKQCDENGILVWQDLMFAGSVYPGDTAFLGNATQEVIDNVQRLHNHPCIALWCGNNEIDEGWNNWGWQKQYHYSTSDSLKLWKDYQKLFEIILPDVLRQQDPERFYIASSPFIGWAHAESVFQGDAHYWGVWWGQEPFSAYESHVGRFMSEYGFQGMPSYSSFKKFSDEKDLSLASLSVKNHEKHSAGFQTIQKYLERDYKQPKDFENYCYVSQLLQAEGMKTAIESHRRAKSTCMGTLYWQLNDCWPGISWSSTDYFGNWKASHYVAKSAYQKFLISAENRDSVLSVTVVSDEQTLLKAKFRLQLMDFGGIVLWKDSGNISVKYANSKVIFTSPVSKILGQANKGKVLLKMEIENDKKILASNVFYFTEPKNLSLEKPEIKYDLVADKVNKFSLTLISKTLAKNIFIDFADEKIKLSDNYFDLLPGEKKTVEVESSLDLNALTQKIKVKSLFDTY